MLSGSANKCWLRTCDACLTTWRLGKQLSGISYFLLLHKHEKLSVKPVFLLVYKHKHKDISTRRIAYLTQFLIPALLKPVIKKMVGASSAILFLICSHEVWVKVAYDWSKTKLKHAYLHRY